MCAICSSPDVSSHIVCGSYFVDVVNGFVTKFGRPKAMMPVPIVFLLIRSYLVHWPFYLSVCCVNE